MPGYVYEYERAGGPLKILGVLSLITALLLAILIFDPLASTTTDPVALENKGRLVRIEIAPRGFSMPTESIEWKETYPAWWYPNRYFSYTLPIREERSGADPVDVYASIGIEKGLVVALGIAVGMGETNEIALKKKFRIEKGSLYLFRVDGKRFLIRFGPEDEKMFFSK
jgi:hypothetical protein